MTELLIGIFNGISIGSVLLISALGLAIVFGLMGVINLAHGELMMLGAYTTYVVQNVFKGFGSPWFDLYVLFAIPIAFLVTAAVGFALERGVIRFLYGRPLETLLATWGVSLILQQFVRSVNWMFVIYSTIFFLVFSIISFLLNRNSSHPHRATFPVVLAMISVSLFIVGSTEFSLKNYVSSNDVRLLVEFVLFAYLAYKGFVILKENLNKQKIYSWSLFALFCLCFPASLGGSLIFQPIFGQIKIYQFIAPLVFLAVLLWQVWKIFEDRSESYKSSKSRTTFIVFLILGSTFSFVQYLINSLIPSIVVYWKCNQLVNFGKNLPIPSTVADSSMSACSSMGNLVVSVTSPVQSLLSKPWFSARNVDVTAPKWLQGGVAFGTAQLPYSRIFIIVLTLICLGGMYWFLTKSNWGLRIRSVTQNRQMSSCLGIPTAKVDALTFALGSGLAGIAGVAIAMLGSVGPNTGQNYIVDAFMVVVVGGVGNLLGTILAAMGLGIVNYLIGSGTFVTVFTSMQAPQFLIDTTTFFATTSMAKVMAFVIIIAFLQFRPAGLFPPKGRTAEL